MKNINNLLERYWAAETSLEDEATLKEYFKNGAVSPEHQSFASLFETFEHDSNHTCDIDVAELLKKEAEKESKTETKVEQKATPKVFTLRKYIPAVAAIFLTLFAVVTIFNMNDDIDQLSNVTVLEEQSQQEEAIEITKKALALLSNNYSKGTQAIKKTYHVEKVDIFKTN